MYKKPYYIIGLLLSFAAGYLANDQLPLMSREWQQPQQIPAYLVAGWQINAPDKLGPFGEQVIPLAKAAGYELLGNKEPQLLEGEWPYPGVVIVQRYQSMVALKTFWNAPEHRDVIKLREGYVDSHFVIAVEGVNSP